MADYDTYGGNFMLPHPYAVKNVTGYGVALDGTYDTIQKFVDRRLNCGGHDPQYHLVSSTVLFTFMRMGCMECSGHPQDGSFSEKELNVTLLLLAVDGIKMRLVWYMPYLWLDSGPALIAGRDIYGFPKQTAKVEIPQLGGTAELKVSAEVLHRHDGLPGVEKEILSVKRKPGGVIEKESDATNLADALVILLKSVFKVGKFVPAPLSKLSTLGLAVPVINPGDLKMVWMRQHPSIWDFTKACFRSVAEASFTVTLRGAGLLKGDYEVSIPWHHSVDIAKELGITKGNTDLITSAKAAYHMDFDFVLGKGEDLWVEHEK